MARKDSPLIIKKNSDFSSAELDKIFLDPSLNKASIERQLEFKRGRWCAQEALHRLGVKQDKILRAQDRAPIWPESIVGSISHSRRYSCAVVGYKDVYRSLGIDIEEIGRVKDDVARLVLRERELELFQQEWERTLVFSAKESLYKLLYPEVKCYFGFQAAEVVQINQSCFGIHFVEQVGDFIPNTLFTGNFRFVDQHILTMISLSSCY